MKNVQGKVFKYGDNVDTDVIIPARYLNTPDANALAAHCMEDIDKLVITLDVDQVVNMRHLRSRLVKLAV